jgi:hypothetical protein
VFICKNGSAEENMAAALEDWGRLSRVIGADDIVIVKPNAQRAGGHGNTHTNTVKALIQEILDIPGFKGEIIIGENHHDLPHDSRGWNTIYRNGDYNLNELVEEFQEKGYANVTRVRWKDGGPNPNFLQFQAGNGGIVEGPWQGEGYVWPDTDYVISGRRTKMTYPVFRSSFSGKMIDLKNGVWENGQYTGQAVRLINIAILAHHSDLFGVTGAVKNYLGIVDMTCGEHGPEPKDYYNFHYISIGWPRDAALGNFMEKCARLTLVRRSRFMTKVIRRLCPAYPEALGAAVGFFMNNVRKADLNILAAEYVGHEGRYDPPAHAKAVALSTDPVALDYIGARNLLLPFGGSRKRLNDPDNPKGPFHWVLLGCAAEGGGNMNSELIHVHTRNLDEQITSVSGQGVKDV